MARKGAAVVKEAEVVVVPERPYVLVEAPDGSGAYRVDVPVDRGCERVLSVDGVSYEHCADAPDGRWIYRVSR